MARDPQAPPDARRCRKPLGELPALVSRGQFFGRATGEYFTAKECSGLSLFSRFLHGEDIDPFLDQRQALGFNLLRVWTLRDFAPPNPPLLLEEYPELYERWPEFVGRCAARGLYVEGTAYAGTNDPDHWPRLIEASLQCSTLPLLEYVNELSVNVNEADHVARVMLYTKDPDKKQDTIRIRLKTGEVVAEHQQAPSPLLSSHGSNGSDTFPPRPHWSYGCYHTNGAPEEQRKVGHNAVELWASGPMLTNETSRWPDVGMWRTTQAKRLTRASDAAAGAALLCAGSCFHSQAGKLGLVITDPEELAGARAWVAGADSVPLKYQDGAYQRIETNKPEDVLRIYRRALSKTDYHEVRIRE